MSGDHGAENIHGRHARRLHCSKAIIADAISQNRTEQNSSGPKSGPELFYALNEPLVAIRQGSAEVSSCGKLFACPIGYK
jgi:hypothetical protein